MDHIQATPPNMPHIVQVYQPNVTNTKIQNPQIIHISHPSLQTSQGKITYQQTITSESMPIAASENVQTSMHNQIVMSCQQTHLQSIHQPIATMPSQVLQSSDINQPLQFTSHMILPQVPLFKQHMLVDGQQQHYYGQYDSFIKDQHCIITKIEIKPDQPMLNAKHIECNSENATQNKTNIPTERSKKKIRSQVPNPNSWACNVRKQKHQRGEAYVNRRGKYVAERRVRNTKDCLTSCKYKCNERIDDTDREHIFKAFYSLTVNEKRHFLLNTTERNLVRNIDYKLSNGSPKRKYSFKYFFLVRAVRYTVCKNFYLGTLAISQKPVYNVHASKSEMNIPKPDGRGLSLSSTHEVPSELKDRVRKHIMSFETVDSKTVKQFSRRKQFLDSGLTVKQMFIMYHSKCLTEDAVPVKESMYRKIFRQEFNLHFKKSKAVEICGKCREPMKKK